MASDPYQILVRLGLDERTLRRLQALGHLEALSLTGADVRERLYRAHRAYILRREGRTSTSGLAPGSSASAAPGLEAPSVEL